MNVRPTGPDGASGRGPGRAGALAAPAPTAKRALAQIRARITSGYYDRDHVRDQVLRCILRTEFAGQCPWDPRD